MTLRQRVEELKARQGEVAERIAQMAEDATRRAVDKAAELTPPTGGDLKGAHTRAGELKAHWGTDSQTKPTRQGETLTTALANDLQYASYVNDGHRVDRHFVPGLYLNPYSGLLEYDPARRDVGIVVGTKTTYVKGLFMAEEAKEEYRKALQEGARGLEDLLK